LYTCKITTATR